MSLIWVTGSYGQVGIALQRLLQNGYYPWEVRFFTRAEFDLTQEKQMLEWFSREKPFCIVNLAAYTAVDKAESEPEQAYAVNAIGVEKLATLCALYAVPIIHVSTDYVFSGQSNDPYIETAAVAPESIYGKSKAMGETLLRANHSAHIILRTSWVFSADEGNFVTKILGKGAHYRAVYVVSDQTGCPTAAHNLAVVLCQMISRIIDGDGVYGTYHYRDDETHSWFSFAKKIFKMAATRCSIWDETAVFSTSTAAYPTSAVRPSYSVLSVDKLIKDYGICPMSCTDALQDVVTQFVEQLNDVSA